MCGMIPISCKMFWICFLLFLAVWAGAFFIAGHILRKHRSGVENVIEKNRVENLSHQFQRDLSASSLQICQLYVYHEHSFFAGQTLAVAVLLCHPVEQPSHGKPKRVKSHVLLA